MNQVINFILQNWRLIIEIITLIISIILFVLSKFKKIGSSVSSEALLYVYQNLPDLIAHVEVPGHGAEKLKVVLQLALELLQKYFGRSLTEDEVSHYSVVIKNNVEKILSTPTKKGE